LLHQIRNQHLHKINESSANKQIGLEINIYTEINASNGSNQIGLEINIHTESNASNASNQI